MSREVKPLLHTWSLSIEEQFYLLFPLLLAFLFKFKSRTSVVLLLLAAASLFGRWRYIQLKMPSEEFFSFLGRIWEFIVGASIVFTPKEWRTRISVQPVWVHLAFAVILISIFALDEGLPYAGLLLIAPCIATALAIMSCEGGTPVLLRWLGCKPMVFIGAISYSLYLWHWPLMVLFRQSDWGLSSNEETLLLILVTLSASYLAWRFIEEPFRRNKQQYSGKVVACAVVIFGLFCAGAGGFIYAKSGMESRFPNYSSIEKNVASFDFSSQTGVKLNSLKGCSSDAKASDIAKDCAIGNAEVARRFLVVGDSHAGSWIPAFDAAGQKNQWQGTVLSLPGCPPVIGIHSWDGAKDICHPNFEARLKSLLDFQKYEKVFLVAYWSMYSEGDERRPHHFISDANNYANDAATSKAVLARNLQKTIQILNAKGIEVVIVHTVPTLPKRIQDLPDDFVIARSDVEARNRFMNETIHSQITKGRLIAIDAASVLCDSDICKTRINGYVTHVDNNHISPAFAALLIPLVQSALN
jgi:sulfur relay (sulfurtransferase) DsrF/TusC family protein